MVGAVPGVMEAGVDWQTLPSPSRALVVAGEVGCSTLRIPRGADDITTVTSDATALTGAELVAHSCPGVSLCVVEGYQFRP